MDKLPSANDAWRKLHSDPLLIIRQREQQALARVKNNPIQMAMIRKTVSSNFPCCFIFSFIAKQSYNPIKHWLWKLYGNILLPFILVQ